MKTWYYFKAYFRKCIYLLLFLVPILFLIILLISLFTETGKIEILICVIPAVIFGMVILFSVKETFRTIDSRLDLELNPFNDFEVVSEEEYVRLLNNTGTNYIVHKQYVFNYRKLYIMTEDRKLLFKIIQNKIYSPYDKRVGSIRTLIFYPVFLVKIKDLFSFIAVRNLGTNFSKYYVPSRAVVYDEENNSVRSSKDNSIICTISDREDGEYNFKMKTSEFCLESIFLQIEAGDIEHSLLIGN